MAAWIVSPTLSWIAQSLSNDSLITIGAILLILLGSSGVFNSCTCVSAVFSRREDAFVALDADEQRRGMSRKIYPILAFSTLICHIFVYIIMRWDHDESRVVFSSGLNPVTWSGIWMAIKQGWIWVCGKIQCWYTNILRWYTRLSAY